MPRHRRGFVPHTSSDTADPHGSVTQWDPPLAPEKSGTSGTGVCVQQGRDGGYTQEREVGITGSHQHVLRLNRRDHLPWVLVLCPGTSSRPHPSLGASRRWSHLCSGPAGWTGQTPLHQAGVLPPLHPDGRRGLGAHLSLSGDDGHRPWESCTDPGGSKPVLQPQCVPREGATRG